MRKTHQVYRKIIANFTTEEVLGVVEEQVLFLLPLLIRIRHHLRQITVQQGTTLLLIPRYFQNSSLYNKLRI